MGFFGDLFNPITQKVGVKLFPGGPYPDQGIGDKVTNASMPLQTAGQGFLSQAQSALPDIYSQIAQMSGVRNPFVSGGQQPTGTNAQGNAIYSPNAMRWSNGMVMTPDEASKQSQGGGQQQNPYELFGPHLTEFNNRASQINQMRKQRLSQFRGSTAARGLGQSGLQAYEQRLNDQFDSLLQDEYTKSAMNAYNAKQSALNAFLQSATQSAQMGAGMIGQNTNALQNQQQVALNATNSANNALFGLGGFIYNTLNPSVPGGGSNPYQGAQGGLQGAQAGAGAGGFNPQALAQLLMLAGGY